MRVQRLRACRSMTTACSAEFETTGWTKSTWFATVRDDPSDRFSGESRITRSEPSRLWKLSIAADCSSLSFERGTRTCETLAVRKAQDTCDSTLSNWQKTTARSSSLRAIIFCRTRKMRSIFVPASMRASGSQSVSRDGTFCESTPQSAGMTTIESITKLERRRIRVITSILMKSFGRAITVPHNPQAEAPLTVTVPISWLMQSLQYTWPQRRAPPFVPSSQLTAHCTQDGAARGGLPAHCVASSQSLLAKRCDA